MNNHDTGVAIVWPAQIKSIEMREGGSLIRTGNKAGRQAGYTFSNQYNCFSIKHFLPLIWREGPICVGFVDGADVLVGASREYKVRVRR